MNRRELLAGVASVGVLGGSAAVLWRGLSFGEGADSPSESATDSAENDSDGDTTDSSGPFELETLEAPGSEAETLTVPNDGLTLAMFFSPVCSRCQSLMPNMADAQTRLSDQYGDELTVVSVTGQQSPEQLREWWVDHDGDWTLAYDDGRVLTDRYDVVTHPVLMVIDSTGAVQWESEAFSRPTGSSAASSACSRMIRLLTLTKTQSRMVTTMPKKLTQCPTKTKTSTSTDDAYKKAVRLRLRPASCESGPR